MSTLLIRVHRTESMYISSADLDSYLESAPHRTLEEAITRWQDRYKMGLAKCAVPSEPVDYIESIEVLQPAPSTQPESLEVWVPSQSYPHWSLYGETKEAVHE